MGCKVCEGLNPNVLSYPSSKNNNNINGSLSSNFQHDSRHTGTFASILNPCFLSFTPAHRNSKLSTFSNVQIYPILNPNAVGFSPLNRTENCSFAGPPIVINNNSCFLRSGINVLNDPNGPNAMFHPSRGTPAKKELNHLASLFNPSLNPNAEIFYPREPFNDPFDKFNTLNPYSDNGMHRQASNLNQCANSFYPIEISIPNCVHSPQTIIQTYLTTPVC